MLGPGTFVVSVPVYNPPEITLHAARNRPSSSLSYISRNRHIRNPHQRPQSSMTQKSSSSEMEINIERRMIWNDTIIGMVKEERGRMFIVRVYMRNEELLIETPLEKWPKECLKPISRHDFVSKIKIPFIEQQWISKEAKEAFLMSNLEKGRLEVNSKRFSTLHSGQMTSESSSLNKGTRRRASSSLGFRGERPIRTDGRKSSLGIKRPSSSIAYSRSTKTFLNSHPSTLIGQNRKELSFPRSPIKNNSSHQIQLGSHTTTEDDVQYLENLIQMRKKAMQNGKIGTYFLDQEQIDDLEVKRLNRMHSTSMILEEIPTPFLTQMFDTIRKETDTASELSDTTTTTKISRRNGVSRMDRLLISKRETCVSQLQTDFDSRRQLVQMEMENDGIVMFGKDTNYEHFFKAKIVSIDYIPQNKQLVIGMNTRGIHHDGILDGIFIPSNYKDEAISLLWSQIREQRNQMHPHLGGSLDIVYFPIKTNSLGQLFIDAFIDLQWIQCTLLSKGFAHIDDNLQGKLGLERLLEHQMHAKKERLGMWKNKVLKRRSESLLFANTEKFRNDSAFLNIVPSWMHSRSHKQEDGEGHTSHGESQSIKQHGRYGQHGQNLQYETYIPDNQALNSQINHNSFGDSTFQYAPNRLSHPNQINTSTRRQSSAKSSRRNSARNKSTTNSARTYESSNQTPRTPRTTPRCKTDDLQQPISYPFQKLRQSKHSQSVSKIHTASFYQGLPFNDDV